MFLSVSRAFLGIILFPSVIIAYNYGKYLKMERGKVPLFLESRCDDVRSTRRRPEFDDGPLNHKTTHVIHSDKKKKN